MNLVDVVEGQTEVLQKEDERNVRWGNRGRLLLVLRLTAGYSGACVAAWRLEYSYRSDGAVTRLRYPS